ncbi:MAG: hypothetical protein AB2748_19795 [Candidatus Thiodiazotropha endolucinida]
MSEESTDFTAEGRPEYTIEDVRQQFNTTAGYLDILIRQFHIFIIRDEIKRHIEETGRETGCCDHDKGVYCEITRYLDMRLQELIAHANQAGGSGVH